MPIIAIPGLVAIWYLITKGYKDAFLSVYVTALLVLPNWPHWLLTGLPDPTFNEAVILPIAFVYLVKEAKNWKFSFMDFLVGGLLGAMALSEFLNTGYNEAQNLMFDRVAAGLLPYVLAKGIIESNGLTVAFAKRFVWCLGIIFPIALFEFKFGYNPFRSLLDPFFPGQGTGWVTTFRYGLARFSGPYSHAILAGVVFMIGAHLQLWLAKNNHWEPRFRPAFLASINKSLAFSIATLGGLIIAVARGPQIGGIMGWICGFPGRGRNPKVRARMLLAAIVFIGLPLVIWSNSYVAVGRAGAASASQETAAYRKELIDKYIPIVLEKSLLGWGLSTWPKVPGMPSIDNYYLLLALQHGTIATGFLLAMFAALIFRLYRNAMKYAAQIRPGTSLSFALMGIYIGLTFSLATVFLGENLMPIVFLLTGFAEGYLLAGGDQPRGLARPQIVKLTQIQNFSFQRVVT